MRDIRGTFKVDRTRIFEYRLKARLLILLVFFIFFLFQLVIGISKNDDRVVSLGLYTFSAILGFTLFVCLVVPTRAERTVISIDDKDIKRLIDGVATTTIGISEVGSMKNITNGFLIIRKFHKPEGYIYNDNFHEDLDRPHIIYVPNIIEDYIFIYQFIENTVRKNSK